MKVKWKKDCEVEIKTEQGYQLVQEGLFIAIGETVYKIKKVKGRRKKVIITLESFVE